MHQAGSCTHAGVQPHACQAAAPFQRPQAARAWLHTLTAVTEADPCSDAALAIASQPTTPPLTQPKAPGLQPAPALTHPTQASGRQPQAPRR